MDEAENLGAWTAFMESADDVGIRHDIGMKLAGFYIEDKDEDGNGAKDVVARLGEVVFNEAVLSIYDEFAG